MSKMYHRVQYSVMTNVSQTVPEKKYLQDRDIVLNMIMSSSWVLLMEEIKAVSFKTVDLFNVFFFSLQTRWKLGPKITVVDSREDEKNFSALCLQKCLHWQQHDPDHLFTAQIIMVKRLYLFPCVGKKIL